MAAGWEISGPFKVSLNKSNMPTQIPNPWTYCPTKVQLLHLDCLFVGLD